MACEGDALEQHQQVKGPEHQTPSLGRRAPAEAPAEFLFPAGRLVPGRAGERQLRALQRTGGNRSVSNLVSRRKGVVAPIQRHPEGTELPEKEAQVAEIE